MKLAHIVCSFVVYVACLVSAYATPTVFHSTESAGPGDVISLQGDSFGANAQVWMQHVVGTEASLSPQVQLKVLSNSATTVTALIPSNETTGLYAIWVYDGTNYSPNILINAARAWGANDLCGTDIDPSRSFRLFGRNLYLGTGTPTVTFVNGATTLTATVTTSGSDDNILHVTAPAGIVAGTVYTVNVNNGYGGHYGTSSLKYTLTGLAAGADPFGLGVPWGSVFANTATHVINVKTAYGAYGDGVHDDTVAVENALMAAYGASPNGGTVYFPTGTYQLNFGHYSSSFIYMFSNTVLMGDGPNLSTLVLSNPTALPGYNFGITTWQSNNIGFYNIGVHNLDGAHNGSQTAIEMRQGNHLFFVNSKFVADGGKNMWISDNNHVLYKNCTISNTSTVFGGASEPIYNPDNTDVLFTGNTVSWTFARVRFFNSTRSLLENNTLTRNAINNGVYLESGAFDITYCDSMVVLNNTVNKGGVGPLTENNDGETILVQGTGPANQNVGTVSSATSTTLTDTTKNWTYNYAVSDFGTAGQLYYVIIVGGPGAGQYRQMTSNTTTTLTVSPPWQVTPTSASNYSITHMDAAHHLIKNNNLSQNTQGIEYYAASYLDTTIVGNTMVDNGGIWMRSDYRPNAFQVNMDTQILNNNVSNPSNMYHETDSYSKIYFETGGTAPSGSFGTTVFNGDIRNNVVTAQFPNQLSGSSGEGYALGMFGSQQNDTTKAMTGVVFQGNVAENCTNAFHLCTGNYYTTIWDNDTSTCTNLVTDLVQGSGTHASIGTVYGSLTGHWDFDSGTTADSSGNNGNGSTAGTPTLSTDLPYTTLGNVYSMQFNGSSWVAVPDSQVLDTGRELTVAFWMKADLPAPTYERPIAKEQPSSATGWSVQMTNSLFYMRVDTSAAGNQLKVGVPGLLDGNWHFVTYVLNHGTISSYKDGVLVATQPYLEGNGFGGNGQPIDIGALGAGGYPFRGKLDDVQVYAQPMTSTEVSQLYSTY